MSTKDAIVTGQLRHSTLQVVLQLRATPGHTCCKCGLVHPDFSHSLNEKCQRKDRPRAKVSELSGEEEVPGTLPVRTVRKQYAQSCERMLSCALSRMERWASVTSLTCRNQFQTDLEGDGHEPSGGNLTGPGFRAEGMVLNMGLCNEMRTVSGYDWWRSRNVRAVRQLELLFFRERERGDVRRSRSSQLRDFQDVKLGTCNLQNLSMLCATSVRCGTGAWRGVL